MLLVEFFYFKPNTSSPVDDNRYENSNDTSVLEKDDTRKLRLTLKQINTLRKQSEMHEAELQAESEFVRSMYGQPPAAAAAE